MALDILRRKFHGIIVEDQDCFAQEDGWETLLQLLPDSDDVRQLRKRWEVKPLSSVEKWRELDKVIKTSQNHASPLTPSPIA